MNQPASDSNDVLSYALQRRALITQACEMLETLGLPVERAPFEPAVALRALAYNWAINVHPDLMRWYRDAALDTQAKCRQLQVEQGIEAAAGIDKLVVRDLKVFATAIDTYHALPTEMQKHIIDLAAPMHPTSIIVSPLRLTTILPGTLLLAWDQAWRDAIEAFGEHVGDVIQVPAAIDGFHSRIDDLEESVQLMRNRFIAISAAADFPVEAPAPPSDPSEMSGR